MDEHEPDEYTVSQKTRKARHSSTNRKQFWLSGSPEVTTDGATRQKTNLPTFSFLEPCAYLASFGSYGEKNEISEKKFVAMATSLENSKIELQIFHLQP